jgi:hypothetical protein
MTCRNQLMPQWPLHVHTQIPLRSPAQRPQNQRVERPSNIFTHSDGVGVLGTLYITDITHNYTDLGFELCRFRDTSAASVLSAQS